MILYPYQQDCIDQIRAGWRAGNRGVFLVAPTGAGKTVIFCTAVRRAADRGRRVLIVVPRRELVAQVRDTLRLCGLEPGIIAAGWPQPRPRAAVQVASAWTLKNRPLPWPDGQTDLTVWDEAHMVRAATYEALLDRFRDAFRILASATPQRLDGKGFAPAWATATAESPQVPDLIEMGRLCAVETFAPPGVDLSGLKRSRGDFVQGDMAARFDRPALLGDVVREWTRHCRGRQGIIFAAGVQHSRNLTARLVEAGVRAVHLDGTTPAGERDRIVQDLRDGRVDAVCNYGILTEGFDAKNVSAIMVVRATESLVLWLQMAGRGLRALDGKDRCLLFDFGSNCERHGLVDTRRTWDLRGRKRRTRDPDELVLTTCPDCFAVYPSHPGACPRCGCMKIPRPRVAPRADRSVDLVRVARNVRKRHPNGHAPVPPWCGAALWDAIEAERIEKGFKRGWSYHAARRRMALRGGWRAMEGGAA